MFKTQHFLMFVLAAHICSRFASGDDNVGSGSNSDSSGGETIEKIITASHVDASTARASTSATFAPKATGTAPPASASATKVPAAGAGAGASAAATLKVSTGPMQSATTTAAAADSDNAPPAPPGYGDGCQSTAPTILYFWIGVAVAVVWGLCSTGAACVYYRRSATLELQLDLMRRSRQRQNKHRHAASGSLPSLAKDADALPLSTAAKDSDPKNQPQHPSFPASCLKPQHAANSAQAPAPSCAKPQHQQQQQQQPSRSAWHSKLDETPRYVDLEEISIDGVRATMASASATMASMLLHGDDDRNGSSMGRNDAVASNGQSPCNSSSTLSSSGDKKGSRAALLRPQLRRCKYVQDAAAGGQRCKLNAASGTPHGYCVKHTCPTPGCPNSKKSLEALCETCALEDAASTAEIVYEEPCHQALLIYDAANAARSPPATAVESPLAAATPASAEPSEMLNAYPLLGIMMHAGVDGESSTDDAHAGTNGLQNSSSSSSRSSGGGGGELEEMEF